MFSTCAVSDRSYAVLVLLVGSVVAATLAQHDETCYADDKNPYVYYDSKTAYEFVHGKKQIPPVACEYHHTCCLRQV